MLTSRYQKRLSGPLPDRIDIHVEVLRVPFQKLSDERRGEPSAAIWARADTGPTQVRDHCPAHPLTHDCAVIGDPGRDEAAPIAQCNHASR